MLSTHMRPLGQSAVNLSVLGFGAAPIGNLYQAVADEQAVATVDEALALGIRYIDTAPHYGFGLSESRLGAALQFPAAHPQICSVIAGLASPQQVKQAVTWMNQTIPDDFWLALRELGLLHHQAPVPSALFSSAKVEHLYE